MQTICAAGTHPDTLDKAGRTALLVAARSGHADICAYLIEQGASTSACDRRGYTPVHHACIADRLDALRALLSAAVTASAQNGSASRAAASVLDAEEVEFMLQQSQGSVSAEVADVPSPLHLATLHRAARCIGALLTAGHTASVRDEQQRTALHLAAAQGDTDCIAALLRHDATLLQATVRCGRGVSPSHSRAFVICIGAGPVARVVLPNVVVTSDVRKSVGCTKPAACAGRQGQHATACGCSRRQVVCRGRAASCWRGPSRSQHAQAPAATPCA